MQSYPPKWLEKASVFTKPADDIFEGSYYLLADAIYAAEKGEEEASHHILLLAIGPLIDFAIRLVKEKVPDEIFWLVRANVTLTDALNSIVREGEDTQALYWLEKAAQQEALWPVLMRTGDPKLANEILSKLPIGKGCIIKSADESRSKLSTPMNRWCYSLVKEIRHYRGFNRTPGKGHKYQFICDKALFFVHSEIDDFGLSVSAFRVLAHMGRLSGKEGEFFINKSKFASKCGLHRETIDLLLTTLEDMGLFCTTEERKNPRCLLTLCDRFPDAQITAVPKISNGHQPVGNQERSVSERSNGMTESSSGHCRKGVTEGSPSEDSPREGNPATSGKPTLPPRYLDEEVLAGFEKDATWQGLNIREQLAQMQAENGNKPSHIRISNFLERLMRARKQSHQAYGLICPELTHLV